MVQQSVMKVAFTTFYFTHIGEFAVFSFMFFNKAFIAHSVGPHKLGSSLKVSSLNFGQS